MKCLNSLQSNFAIRAIALNLYCCQDISYGISPKHSNVNTSIAAARPEMNSEPLIPKRFVFQYLKFSRRELEHPIRLV